MKKVLKSAVSVLMALLLVFGMIGNDESIQSAFEIEAEALTMTYSVTSNYRNSKYFTNLCNVSITGNQRTDIVNVARSQIGYHEGASSADVSGSSTGKGDYTEYNNWYYGYEKSAAWCAIFVSFCAAQAGVSRNIVNYTAGASTSSFSNVPSYSKTSCNPEPGDIAFIAPYGGTTVGHVGIIIDVDSSYIYTAEGNCENMVKKGKYYRNSSTNLGYGNIVKIGKPNYNSAHNHDFSVYLWYWKAHPHYNEYKCSYCEATEVRKSETNYLASCEKCNHVHDYTQYTYAPGCTDQGVYHYVCSCGEEYTEVYSAALGHDFSKLSYCEESHPHYKVYRCSNGCGTTQKSNETSYSSSCIQCNPSAFCANLGDDFYGLILNTACWKPISKTAETRDISLQTENGSSMQKWRFQRQSDGAYVITSCYDGTVLEMTDGIREKNGTRMTAKSEYNGENYQQWYLIPQGSGYIFLNKHYPSEQWAMDLSGNYTFDGNGIYIYPINYSDGQIWSVYNRDEVQLQSANLSASVENSKVTFVWPNAYGASSYSLKIFTEENWHNGTGSYMTVGNVKSGHSVELSAGKYYAYIDSEDYYSDMMSNVVNFEISETATSTPENDYITCSKCGGSFADETEYNAHTETCGTDDAGTSLGFFGMLISLFVSFFSLIASIFTLPFALIFG